MKPDIAQLNDSSLLKDIKIKIEAESKCQICWELSVGPVICSHCGNNVGCSNCVNQLFDNPDHTARCPLCNGHWQRAVGNPGDTSLWTGHCPNRALAGILNQIDRPTCSSIDVHKLYKPTPTPKTLHDMRSTPSYAGRTPKCRPKPRPTGRGPSSITSKRSDCPSHSKNLPLTSLNRLPVLSLEEKSKAKWETHKFLSFRYILLFFFLLGHIYLMSNQASFQRVYEKGLSCFGLLCGTIVCLGTVSLHLILLNSLWYSFYEAKTFNQTQRQEKLVRIKLLYTIFDLICIMFISVYLVASNVKVLEFVGVKNMPTPNESIFQNFLFFCFLLAYEGMIAFLSAENFPAMFSERHVGGNATPLLHY